MNTIPPIIATERECLEAWARRTDAEGLRPLVSRYAAFVYASAHRRTGIAEHAAEVTRAVFLVLARRARRLRRKSVLAGWLFQVTAVACRKLKVPPRSPAGTTLWDRVAPEIDAALGRLEADEREAVLLRVLLDWDGKCVAEILRTSEAHTMQRAGEGLRKLSMNLHKRGVPADAEWLAVICAVEGCAAPMPPGLLEEILASLEAAPVSLPAPALARRTLTSLAWARWRRRFAIASPILIFLLATVAGTVWTVDLLSGRGRWLPRFLVWSARNEAKRVPGLAQPARPWPADTAALPRRAANVRTARDLYQTTNLWPAHLKFTREQWSAVQPKRIDALPDFIQPDGSALLRNPEAQRSGLAGVLGFDFPWAPAGLEFGGVTFTNVAARIKGNGTFLSSLHGDKRSFKVDLNKFVEGRKLGTADELSFNNLVNDHSCLSDALAFEFFRDAGVPAPRTAYAYLSVSAEGKWERKPLGLYVMVEAVDEQFAAEHFGSKKTPVFKPVTYELFHDLGDDWPAYEAIYDLKTKATPEQQRRVIEFARLLSHAGDADFAAKVGEFLDLEAFARFLACQVLLSNYDGFLSDGQNFYLCLDPRSNKFVFIPWDMDLSWGGFFLLGTNRERERASIWHPWVGEHRLLERVLAVEEFRKRYRAQLEYLLPRLFVPERLNRRIDDMAAILRSPVAAESTFRLGKFEQAVGGRPPPPSTGEKEHGANRPAHQLKRFIAARATSVREQLDGQSDGMILRRRARK